MATNDTAAGRQQNRRVELVVSGEHHRHALVTDTEETVMTTRTLHIASAALMAALLPGVSWAQDCTADARHVVDAIYRQVLERNANGEGSHRRVDQLNCGLDHRARAGAEHRQVERAPAALHAEVRPPAR